MIVWSLYFLPTCLHWSHASALRRAFRITLDSLIAASFQVPALQGCPHLSHPCLLKSIGGTGTEL